MDDSGSLRRNAQGTLLCDKPLQQRLDLKERNMSDNSREQAEAQLENIIDMMERYEKAQNDGDEDAIEAIRQEVDEDPLEILTRSTEWNTLGKTKSGEQKPDEFMILLCTGGPAVRIIGDLDEHQSPTNIRLEYQGWGEDWQRFYLDAKHKEIALQAYCEIFSFE